MKLLDFAVLLAAVGVGIAAHYYPDVTMLPIVAAYLLGQALPQVSRLGSGGQKFSSPPAPSDPPQPRAAACLLPLFLGFALLTALLFSPNAARAQTDGDHPTAGVPTVDGDHPSTGLGCVDAGDRYCLVYNQALAWSLNVKDFTAKSGALLMGLSLQHKFGSLPVALGIFGGLGASDQGKSYQLCGGVSVTNWGLVCVGSQRVAFDVGGTAWQMVVNLAVQVTSGGPPQ